MASISQRTFPTFVNQIFFDAKDTDALGISQSQYSKLENGEAVFDIQNIPIPV
jgi:hypothetical protein